MKATVPNIAAVALDWVASSPKARLCDTQLLLPQLLAQLARALHEQRAQGKQPDFLGVAFTGEQPVQVNSRSFRFRPSQLPLVESAREFQSYEGPGNHGRKQEDGDPPVTGNQQRGDTDQNHAVLSNLDEACHHPDRAVGGFLLGAEKGIVKTGIFAVFEIQRNGLGMEQVLNVVADDLRLGLPHDPADRG